MEPSWNDFMQVLMRHEEISQFSSSSLHHHLSSKFGDFEQALANLTISKNQEIEVALTTLNKRMDDMEYEIHQIKSWLNIQPMVSSSCVHGEMLPREEGANSGIGTRDKGITPKENEESVSLRGPEIMGSVSSN
jgi:hypothetical protein